MSRLKKFVFLAIGWISVALAILGIILPLLPTTPMLLVAVWAFSKSSPELAARIRNHKTFGPLIRNWQDHGVIPLTGKIAAFLMMTGAAVYLWLYSGLPVWLVAGTTAIMIAAGVFVGSRPSKNT